MSPNPILDYSRLSPQELQILTNIHFAYSTVLGIQAAFLLAEEVINRQIKGDFVECGVATGGLACAMGLALKKHGQLRPFHLFDSYEGLPYAGPQDDCQPGLGLKTPMSDRPLSERLTSCGLNLTSIELVKEHLEQVHVAELPWIFHKGWFQDTLPALPANAIPEIALLHLDGDLYESTLICLEHLYPRVVPGGLVIVDDYGMIGCAKAVSDYFNQNVPALTPAADYISACFFKP